MSGLKTQAKHDHEHKKSCPSFEQLKREMARPDNRGIIQIQSECASQVKRKNLPFKVKLRPFSCVLLSFGFEVVVDVCKMPKIVALSLECEKMCKRNIAKHGCTSFSSFELNVNFPIPQESSLPNAIPETQGTALDAVLNQATANGSAAEKLIGPSGKPINTSTKGIYSEPFSDPNLNKGKNVDVPTNYDWVLPLIWLAIAVMAVWLLWRWWNSRKRRRSSSGVVRHNFELAKSDFKNGKSNQSKDQKSKGGDLENGLSGSSLENDDAYLYEDEVPEELGLSDSSLGGNFRKNFSGRQGEANGDQSSEVDSQGDHGSGVGKTAAAIGGAAAAAIGAAALAGQFRDDESQGDPNEATFSSSIINQAKAVVDGDRASLSNQDNLNQDDLNQGNLNQGESNQGLVFDAQSTDDPGQLKQELRKQNQKIAAMQSSLTLSLIHISEPTRPY